MPKRRSSLSVFNLSFLDIMFCGFGAVVLLVLIIHSRIKIENSHYTQALINENSQIEKQLQAAKIYNQKLTQSLQSSNSESIRLKQEVNTLVSRMQRLKSKESNIQEKIQIQNNKVENIKHELLKTENKKQQQVLADETTKHERDKILQFKGQGQRQYLSGLKLGGKRILILLDSSASMLDSTIVNIIRRRNMNEEKKRLAEKWQRAVKTVHWLIANLPLNSNIQLIIFNTEARSLLQKNSLNWIKAGDTASINQMMYKLKTVTPKRGTSLVNVFKLIKHINPSADNIFLITDGLPTQAGTPSGKNKITGNERVSLFQQAVRHLPKNVPVNTILFPMEGDPMAAALYWKLAVDSDGSFLTPSKDWP